MRSDEKFSNVLYPYIFRKIITPGSSGSISIPLTAHGYIVRCNIIFSAGENGTLRIRPYCIIPGEIVQDLLIYPGDKYISGDDSNLRLDCYQEIEADTLLRVQYENVGVGDSQLIVDIMVQYDDYTAPRNIIG